MSTAVADSTTSTTSEATGTTAAAGEAAGTSQGDAATGASATTQTPPSADAPKAETPAGEVTYDLKLPESAVIDASALERTAAIARELGLSNEAAQTMLGALNREAKAVIDATLAAHAPGGAEWAKQVETWETALKADPALGATPEERQAAVQKGVAVIDRFAQQHPERAQALKSYLDTSGLGSHPDVVHFFAWLGKSASEGGRIDPSATARTGRKSDAELFYGTPAKA